MAAASRHPKGRTREIYSQARACASAEERHRYLVAACGKDFELRRSVESLLEADEAAEGFLADNALGEELEPQAERPGNMLGRYRLVEAIGEGGFGVVWRAEQTEPVKREVALKIIKLGMDTKEVIARFEAERQALALMEHPNIARVYDAGATETGRPYFVMDLIVGQTITEYCDRRNLPVTRRLELFVQVCNAVQHAHQRGIVHRDLKPSNVVVVEEAGKPLVKVIDFGIAKSMQGRLTDRTLVTRREVLLGTPVYMSPEQLNLDADQVDARSDVYSLGVLLYELLAGAPPFEGDTLRKAAFAEVQRILREVEPEKPSTRFEHLGPKTTEIAQRRALEPPQLQRLLRGDLDWVVMRALEKEPARRYASAAALAEDLQHHLRHEPVVARPPSPMYRLGRLYRRHRPAVVAGVAAAVVMVAAALIVWQQRQARQPGQRIVAPEARQLIQEDVVSVEDGALLSPDETMLAYVRWDGPDADLWVRDLLTGEVRNLTQTEKLAPDIHESCFTFVWSPDSKRIAYQWVSGDDPERSLRIIPADGGEINILEGAVPEETWCYVEDWSQDGRELLCRRRGGGLTTWVLVSTETAAVRELFKSGTPEGATHVRLSPDGAFATYALAESGEGQDARHNIYLLEIATGQTNQITSWPSDETTPIWAPYAPVILFSSDRRGSWDLWGVRVQGLQAVSPPLPVRYGVGNHSKRFTRSGKLVVQRLVKPGEGYTIAVPAPAGPNKESHLPGIIYFSVDDRFHTMTPDGINRKPLPPNVRGEPSFALHGGHRWFVGTREVPGEPYPSGDKRRELFIVRGDGDESFTIQLTDDPKFEPLLPRWARDRESGELDKIISWSARLWEGDGSEPLAATVAIYTGKVSFDESGNLVAEDSPWSTGSLTPLLKVTPSVFARPDNPSEATITNVLDAGHDWSPEGDRLAYSVDRQLRILDLASGHIVRLTAGVHPSWSPDGSHIAFHDPQRSIQTIAVDGTDLKTLFEIPHDKRGFAPGGMFGGVSWSPDSSHLLYAYWKPGTWPRDRRIYRVPAEGGESINLTGDVEADFFVAWRGGTP